MDKLPNNYKNLDSLREKFYLATYKRMKNEMITMDKKMQSIEDIEKYLAILPLEYKDIESISQQFAFVKAQYNVFSNVYYLYLMGKIDPTKAEDINYLQVRQAYFKLINSDTNYLSWDLKRGAESWVFDSGSSGDNLILLGVMVGYWENAYDQWINVVENEDNSISFGSNLPSNKQLNTTYYFYVEGNIIGYQTANQTEKFSAYRIIEITEEYIKVYCFKNNITYILTK